MMQDLDKRNPLLASRLIQGLSNWNALVADKKLMVKQALILSQANMSSKNVKETLQSMLNNL
jgi:aminopeptidase N